MLDISKDDILAQVALARRYAQLANIEVILPFCTVYPDGRTEPEDPVKDSLPLTDLPEVKTSPSWPPRELLAIKQALEQYVENEIENGALEDPGHLIHDAKAALETLAKFTGVSVVTGGDQPRKRRGRKPKNITETAPETPAAPETPEE